MTTIRLLSQPALRLPGKEPQALATVDALLLARLLLDGPLSPRALADWLWPDAGTTRAMSHLRQRRYRLKKLAGCPVVVGETLVQVGNGITHDLLDFEAGVLTDINHACGELFGATQVEHHEEQAAWLAQRRAWWLDLKGRALQSALQAAQAQQSPQSLTQALALSQRWVQEQPLSEAAWRSLMQLHHRMGDAAQALQAYESCKSLLQQQQHMPPSEATERLAQLLRSAALPAATPGTPLPAALLRPPVLVERQPLWQQACRALSQGHPVLLEGEAGVGKSRLLGDLVQSWGQGVVVGAVAGDSVLPYALVSRLVGLCVQRWGWPPGTEDQRQLARVAAPAPHAEQELDNFSALHLQRSLACALQHWHQGTQPQAGRLMLLALDDLHHADQASIELLIPVLSNPALQGLAWLLASRPGAATGADGLKALRDVEDLQRLPVPPLTENGVLQLLQNLGLTLADPQAWATGLMQRTGGNPLYVLQTVSTALDMQAQHHPAAGTDAAPGGHGTAPAALAPVHLPLPAPLLALVSQRLDRLSPTARALVRLAAVAGGNFDLRLAAQLLQQPPLQLADPWLELQAAHIMGDQGFAHDLIQEAAKTWTPAGITQLLHEQIAGTLQQMASPAARVAPHWEAAACWSQAAQAYEQAAVEAARLGATSEELHKHLQAAHCHRQAGHAGPAFESEARAARLMILSSMLGAEVQHRCQALLNIAVGDLQRAQALQLLAHFHNEQFHPEQGLPLAEQALQLAQSAGAEHTVLRAAQQVGYALARLGRAQEAVALLQPLRQRAAELPPQERMGWRASLAMVLDYAEQWQQAIQVCDEVIADAQPLQQWQAVADAWGHKGVALGYLGRLKASHEATSMALQISEQHGAPESALLVDRATVAANLRDLGRFADYLHMAETLPMALREQGNPFWAQNAENDLAVAWTWLGRTERALPLLDVAAADLTPLALALRWRTRARLAHSLGLRVAGLRAPQMAAQAMQCLQGQQIPEMLRLSMGLAVALTGETETGLAFAEEAEAQGLQHHNAMLVLAAQVTQLDLALHAAQQPRAAVVAQRLLQTWSVDALPAGPYVPEVGWLCHRALVHQAPELARDVLRQTADWITQRLQHDVPQIYRDSFTQRNPVNAAVLLAFKKAQDHGQPAADC